jgi:hypothetical protein
LPYPKPLIKNDIKKLLSQIYNENWILYNENSLKNFCLIEFSHLKKQ